MISAISAAMLALAQPATGATGVDCVLSSIAASDRTLLVANALSGRTDGFDALLSALRICGHDKLGPEEQGTIAGAALSILLRNDSEEKLAAAGISTREIDLWFGEQDAQFQINPEVTDAEAMRLIDHLRRQSVAMELLDANATAIGTYLGALIMLRRVESGLPLD